MFTFDCANVQALNPGEIFFKVGTGGEDPGAVVVSTSVKLGVGKVDISAFLWYASSTATNLTMLYNSKKFVYKFDNTKSTTEDGNIVIFSPVHLDSEVPLSGSRVTLSFS